MFVKRANLYIPCYFRISSTPETSFSTFFMQLAEVISSSRFFHYCLQCYFEKKNRQMAERKEISGCFFNFKKRDMNRKRLHVLLVISDSGNYCCFHCKMEDHMYSFLPSYLAEGHNLPSLLAPWGNQARQSYTHIHTHIYAQITTQPDA